ncbi:hypothetical protein H8S84_04360 [Pontibacter sp. SD6]|uniref:DUF4595 domain-containing protein n=2 Tax=Pontibacter cellulosilyticus TaxID=1720253 RepID=A0A923SIV3_9BACT|nr:hypothetical protein [Pontibacter cellulosilyticus]
MGLSVILSSCEKEDILPDKVTTPTGPGTTTPPTTTTPPPATTPPPVNTTPPATGTGTLITRIGARVYTYDAQQRLTEVSYTYSPIQGYTVVYEGNKPVRLNYKGGSNYMLYTYEGDKVVEAKSYYGENLVNYHFKFEYDGDLLVKETQVSYARSDEGRLGITAYAYDAKGNLSKITTTWSTSNRVEDMGRPSVITFGNYDNQKHPESFIATGMYYLPGVKLFENNPGYRNPGYGKEFFSYSFNDKGYPVNRYTKLEAYPHVQPHVDSYEYK